MKMANELIDLKGLLFLVLFTIPLTTSTNIDCSGKPFHCLNSTHFMICVDLGGGVTTTIDDFVIPCPPTTVCLKDNRFECEFPKKEDPPPTVSVIGISEANELDNVNSTASIEVVTEINLPMQNETTTTQNALKTLKEENTGGNEYESSTLFTTSVPIDIVNSTTKVEDIITSDATNIITEQNLSQFKFLNEENTNGSEYVTETILLSTIIIPSDVANSTAKVGEIIVTTSEKTANVPDKIVNNSSSIETYINKVSDLFINDQPKIIESTTILEGIIDLSHNKVTEKNKFDSFTLPPNKTNEKGSDVITTIQTLQHIEQMPDFKKLADNITLINLNSSKHNTTAANVLINDGTEVTLNEGNIAEKKINTSRNFDMNIATEYNISSVPESSFNITHDKIVPFIENTTTTTLTLTTNRNVILKPINGEYTGINKTHTYNATTVPRTTTVNNTTSQRQVNETYEFPYIKSIENEFMANDTDMTITLPTIGANDTPLEALVNKNSTSTGYATEVNSKMFNHSLVEGPSSAIDIVNNGYVIEKQSSKDSNITTNSSDNQNNETSTFVPNNVTNVIAVTEVNLYEKKTSEHVDEVSTVNPIITTETGINTNNNTEFERNTESVTENSDVQLNEEEFRNYTQTLTFKNYTANEAEITTNVGYDQAKDNILKSENKRSNLSVIEVTTNSNVNAIINEANSTHEAVGIKFETLPEVVIEKNNYTYKDPHIIKPTVQVDVKTSNDIINIEQITTEKQIYLLTTEIEQNTTIVPITSVQVQDLITAANLFIINTQPSNDINTENNSNDLENIALSTETKVVDTENTVLFSGTTESPIKNTEYITTPSFVTTESNKADEIQTELIITSTTLNNRNALDQVENILTSSITSNEKSNVEVNKAKNRDMKSLLSVKDELPTLLFKDVFFMNKTADNATKVYNITGSHNLTLERPDILNTTNKLDAGENVTVTTENIEKVTEMKPLIYTSDEKVLFSIQNIVNGTSNYDTNTTTINVVSSEMVNKLYVQDIANKTNYSQLEKHGNISESDIKIFALTDIPKEKPSPEAKAHTPVTKNSSSVEQLTLIPLIFKEIKESRETVTTTPVTVTNDYNAPMLPSTIKIDEQRIALEITSYPPTFTSVTEKPLFLKERVYLDSSTNSDHINSDVWAPAETTLEPATEPSLIVETINVTDHKSMEKSSFGEIMIGGPIYINKTEKNTTNDTLLRIPYESKIYETITIRTVQQEIGLGNREDLNLESTNVTVTTAYMNVDIGADKNNNDADESKYNSITNKKKSTNELLTIGGLTANYNYSSFFKQLPNNQKPITSNVTVLSKPATDGYILKHSYGSINISNTTFGKWQTNITQKFDRSNSTVEASKTFPNITKPQNSINLKFNSSYQITLNSPTYNISSKQTNQTNNQTKTTIPSLNASTKNNIGNKTNSKSDFNCLNRIRGKYADNKDCRKFYTCIGNLQPMVGTCPNDTVFSDINKQCTRNLSHCVRNNQFHCTKEGRFSDFFKDNIYYICVKNGQRGFFRYKLQCQSDYFLNKITVKCEKNVEIISSLSVSSVSENLKMNIDLVTSEEDDQSAIEFECKKEGKYPYLKDPKKYYVCSKTSKDEYRRKIKKCSNDKVFNKQKKKCVAMDD